jgi:hypothetical protein
MSQDSPSLDCEVTDQGCVLRPRGRWCIDRLEVLDALLSRTQVPHDSSRQSRCQSTGRPRQCRCHAGGEPPASAGRGLVEYRSGRFQPASACLDQAGRRTHRCACAAASPQHRAVAVCWGAQATLLHHELYGQLAFLGRIVEAVGDVLRRPRLLRLREFTAQLETVGLNALPIVMLMTFLIGVVFAFLLGIQVQNSAPIYSSPMECRSPSRGNCRRC